ncbi:MAG TPA: anthranilate synthase component I family protein [Flavobacterium sp.]|nr:anthranilate synthase component I family protein [Flavobacterium sp.]
MRTAIKHLVANPKQFKSQLLHWSGQFREAVFLDSNNYSQKYASFDAVLAADAFTSLKTDAHNAFEDLRQYQQAARDWLFGYLSYDLKNDAEKLKSGNHDGLQFPDLFFFQPKKLFLLKENELEIRYLNMCDGEVEEDLEEIYQISDFSTQNQDSRIQVSQRISKEEYLKKISGMLGHINRGDIYEANFCMEFFAENAAIDPIRTYQKLNEISEPPFAAFFKNHKHFLMSASPERYLRKQNDKIISQPIKGTAKRHEDAVQDENARHELASSAKERSENIMIVDLVRNDLSRTASKGSVEVEELCGAYAFKQVHHLVSTVASRVESGKSPIEIIKASFPMGSMTGAPKIAAMQLIEDLEETKRGIYSGAVGYFTPENDFDFNVVIRSILYSQENKYVSFSVGSAITSLSVPEKEYQECLLKAKAMRTALESYS